MKTYLYRASNLKSTITFQALVCGSKFLALAKNRRFLQFIHNKYHQLLQTGSHRVYGSDRYITYTTRYHFLLRFVILPLVLSVMCGLK